MTYANFVEGITIGEGIFMFLALGWCVGVIVSSWSDFK